MRNKDPKLGYNTEIVCCTEGMQSANRFFNFSSTKEKTSDLVTQDKANEMTVASDSLPDFDISDASEYVRRLVMGSSEDTYLIEPRVLEDPVAETEQTVKPAVVKPLIICVTETQFKEKTDQVVLTEAEIAAVHKELADDTTTDDTTDTITDDEPATKRAK